MLTELVGGMGPSPIVSLDPEAMKPEATGVALQSLGSSGRGFRALRRTDEGPIASVFLPAAISEMARSNALALDLVCFYCAVSPSSPLSPSLPLSPPPSFFFASGVLGLAENPHVSLPRNCCGVVKSSCKPSTNLRPSLRAAATHHRPLFLSAATEQGWHGRLPLMACGSRVLRVKPLSYAASFANFAPQSLHHLLALIIEGLRYRQGCGTPQSQS